MSKEHYEFSILAKINVTVGQFLEGGGKFRLIYSGGKCCALFSVGRVTAYYLFPRSGYSRSRLGKETTQLTEISIINRKLQPSFLRQNADSLAQAIPVFYSVCVTVCVSVSKMLTVLLIQCMFSAVL